MPNTLAHAGAQGLTTRAIQPEVDVRWVYLACVIPDVPWILLRVVPLAIPGSDPVALKSYLIAQASWMGCLLFCGAAAIFAKHPWKAFSVLGGNVGLHLGLDALQTKWGVGVHFLAPFDWTPTSWGLFWPESVPTYCLTALGLLFIGWHWRTSVSEPLALRQPSFPRLAGAGALLGAYFLAPLLFIEKPIETNAHFLKTLNRSRDRAGQPVKFDRVWYVRRQKKHYLKHYGGRVRVEELGVPAPALVSAQGVFASNDKVEITELRVHTRRLRDYPSYLGLALISFLWIRGVWESRNARR